MLRQNLNCPPCSSMGRLFDGVSILLGGPHTISFEGQAAMYLEQLAEQALSRQKSICTYPVIIKYNHAIKMINWQNMMVLLLHDLSAGYPLSILALKFHFWCAKIVTQIVKYNSNNTVILSGGVFQNKLLTELCFADLNVAGYQVFSNEKIPANDSGLALGQISKVKYNNSIKKKELLCV